MKFKRFEDILVWHKAINLNILCYKLFRDSRDYSFRDQILRASVSISNNIAEGFERKSNKEFQQFLYIARGSCGELRSMLYLAKELKYLDSNEFDTLYDKSIEVSKMLYGLISKL